MIKYASIECAIWLPLEEWHEDHACQVLWIYHAQNSRYLFIIVFILWNLKCKIIGIKDNILHERCIPIWGDSSQIYFMFFRAIIS
jgi:hypothetical protein